MRRIVNFSGGLCSWLAAKRVAEQYGRKEMLLLFADTLIEDVDLYRFIVQAACNVGVPLLPIADGRTPWEVFRDERFLGNSRVDPCSKILKRQLLDRWHRENCDPADTTIYVGLNWDEEHRLDRFRKAMEPWLVDAPLCAPPYLNKCDMVKAAEAAKIKVPALYLEGFPHNNCGGGCIKAGISQFVHLHKVRPAAFAEWEANEESLRQHLNRDDVAILRDRRGGTSRPMTLAELRGRIEAGESLPKFEWGGCGCAVDGGEQEMLSFDSAPSTERTTDSTE